MHTQPFSFCKDLFIEFYVHMCILRGMYVYHMHADEFRGADRALTTVRLESREL